jgi:hypothetical protein
MLHLQSPLYITLEVPRIEAFFEDPLTEPLHRERCSVSRALFTYLSKSPEKKPPSRFPLWSPYIEKDAPSPEPSLHIFQNSQERSPFQVPLSQPHRNRCSIPRTFLYLPLEVPTERAPAPGSLSGPLRREMLITRAYCTYLSKFPVKEPPSKFPIGALQREVPITRVFYTYHLESPVKDPPFQVPLSEPP